MEDEFKLTPPDENGNRFSSFKELIFRMFRWKWKSDPRWGPMEAGQLSRVIKEMPFLTPEEFGKALYNLAQSEDIPERQRPGYWLPRIDSYIIHPHNTFGRNPDAINFENKAVSLERSNRAAIERSRALRSSAPANGNTSQPRLESREGSAMVKRSLRLSDGRD